MSKRCCAQHCFNSTLYTKNVSYFSFPKNKFFADQWADLAGRSDLKQKPLNRVIKYFLCSEHFAANCFLDKDTRLILKRNLPQSIALPSIFKNNLQETMQISNPKQSIEVHNIVLLENDDESKKTKICFSEKSVDSYSLDVDSQSTSCDFENSNNEMFVRDEEVVENIERLEDIASPYVDEDQLKDVTTDVLDVAELSSYQCRLCLKELHSDESLSWFKDSLHLQEFINRVMSDKISVGDSFSQVVCKNCENNSLLCLIIIQQMDATQEKIASSTELLT